MSVYTTLYDSKDIYLCADMMCIPQTYLNLESNISYTMLQIETKNERTRCHTLFHVVFQRIVLAFCGCYLGIVDETRQLISEKWSHQMQNLFHHLRAPLSKYVMHDIQRPIGSNWLEVSDCCRIVTRTINSATWLHIPIVSAPVNRIWNECSTSWTNLLRHSINQISYFCFYSSSNF